MNRFVSVISHSLVSYYLMYLQEQGLALPSFQHNPTWTVAPLMSLSQCDTPILHSIKVPISPNTSVAKDNLCHALVSVLHVPASSAICGENYGHPRGQTPALDTAQNPTLALLHMPAGSAGREDLRLLGLCQLPQTESSGIFIWFFSFRN